MAVVITGPAGLIDGAADSIDGTGFSSATVDIQLTGDDTSAISQTISSQTATAANITVRRSLTAPVLGAPVDGLPLTNVDAAAAGSTAPTLEVVVTNG